MKKYSKLGVSKAVKKGLPKGFLEFDANQAEKLKSVSAVILAIAGTAALATVAVVAPNALRLINSAKWAHKTYKDSLTKRHDQKEIIRKSFYYLKSRGYIEIREKGNDSEIVVTEKGKQRLAKLDFFMLSVPKQKWDKNWWFVLADIPTEDYKSRANAFREKLKAMGFYPLQRTVWVYPYDPREQILLIAGHYTVDRFVTTLKASVVENDDNKKLTDFFRSRNLI